jgi:hypothetical protein
VQITSKEIKQYIIEAKNSLAYADKNLEQIRFKLDLEWGENAGCSLDMRLTSAISAIEEARKELDVILDNNKRSVKLNWKGYVGK